MINITDTKLLNDPEYRWNHKEEMSKIMPYYHERKKFGLVVIDYENRNQVCERSELERR